MVADQPSPLGRWRAFLGGVRVRTTVTAVVAVGLALVVGAVALVWTMRDRLLDDAREVTALRAAEIATALEAGDQPALAVAEADEQLVQVVGHDGVVLAASDNVDGLPPVARLAPGRSVRLDGVLGDDELLAVAAGADTPEGPLTVLVARAVDDVLESTQVVTRLLLFGGPMLLLLVGLVTWNVVGRALRPVETIRAEVDEITTADLHRRVPDPRGHDEIARLATTMNTMLARLEEGHRRQRRFVADASHELRSPLASIRQHAEVARAHPDRSSLDALSATVLAESLRLQRLVDDLLLLARADERSLEVHRRAIDLDDLVFEEARRLRDGTDLRVDTRRVSPGRVDGDGAALRRVLRNLAENAARHARGTVAFSLQESGDGLELAVDDDGAGIPPAEWERVLERFVRLDEGRAREAGGAGLGLAIVAELVAAHGGTVSVGDSPLGGARIAVRLPGTARDRGAAPG